MMILPPSDTYKNDTLGTKGMKPRINEHETQMHGEKKSKQVMERDDMLYTYLYIRYYLHKYLSSVNIYMISNKNSSSLLKSAT